MTMAKGTPTFTPWSLSESDAAVGDTVAADVVDVSILDENVVIAFNVLGADVLDAGIVDELEDAAVENSPNLEVVVIGNRIQRSRRTRVTAVLTTCTLTFHSRTVPVVAVGLAPTDFGEAAELFFPDVSLISSEIRNPDHIRSLQMTYNHRSSCRCMLLERRT